MNLLRGTPPTPRALIKKRPTPPTGPSVRQLHQRRLERSRVRGGPRRGPAPDRPLRLALVATAVLTVGTIFGAAIFHVLLIQSEFRLDQLNKEAAKEEARYESLRLDVAQLSAPDRVVAAAQERLGMVVPPAVAYLMAPAPNADEPLSGAAESEWSKVKPHLAAQP
jgi:cell division protein FtsL